MIKVSVTGSIPYQKVMKQLNPKIKIVTAVLYEEIAKYADRFTPVADGGLIGSLRPIKENGYYVGFEYGVEYARRLYFGVDYNFRKDPHPLARAYWTREAFEIFKSIILKAAQKELQ